MLSDLLENIVEIAHRAGEAVLGYYGKAIHVVQKADASPLTAADQASHGLITEALSRLEPVRPVVSEEAAAASTAAIKGDEPFWLVDPLDGTKEFIKQTGEFTVNIALIEDGAPVLGVVHAPVLGVTYLAASGEGVWRLRKGSPREPIHVRQPDLEHLTVVASKDHAGPKVKQLLELAPQIQLASMGSSLKFCLVAEGKADLYLRDGPTMEWDTGAAQCVVETAGGTVADWSGNRLRYTKQDLRNPFLVTVGDGKLLKAEFLKTVLSGGAVKAES